MPPSSGVKYTKPAYRPKICEASACTDSGPVTDSITPRKVSKPAICSTWPGSSRWFTMNSTSSATMP